MSNDYSSFKVVDLKKELKTRGLSTAGNKDELVERLNTHTQNLLGSGSDIDGFGETIAENDILGEDVLGEELDYEEDVLKKSTDLEFPGHNDSGTLDLPTDVSVSSNSSTLDVTVIANNDEPLPQRETQRNVQKAEKKVHLIRNRSLSLLSDADLKENNKLDSNNDEIKERRTSGSGIKINTKLSQSAEDRLEQRKRKFGFTSESDQKAARAARFGLTNDSKKPTESKKVSESSDVLRQRAERFGLVLPTASTGGVTDKNKSLVTLKSRAERFGIVSSPLLNKLSEQEKMQARKNRFLSSSSDPSLEEKKKLRAQRFNIKT